MMKKNIVILALVLIACFATNAMAAPHRFYREHTPPRHVVRVPPHRHHYRHNYAPAIAAGVVGAIIGNYIVRNYYPAVLTGSGNCFTLVSQTTGTTIRKCISPARLATGNIREILYLD